MACATDLNTTLRLRGTQTLKRSHGEITYPTTSTSFGHRFAAPRFQFIKIDRSRLLVTQFRPRIEMSSPVLAGPPAHCCSTGFKHTGTPNGKKITIGGVETYVSEPPTLQSSEVQSKNIVLYFSDIYGPMYVNSQLLQDYFASRGA